MKCHRLETRLLADLSFPDLGFIYIFCDHNCTEYCIYSCRT